MAFTNTAPKVAPATGSVKPSAQAATPYDKPRAKKKPVRGNIGRMLREKL